MPLKSATPAERRRDERQLQARSPKERGRTASRNDPLSAELAQVGSESKGVKKGAAPDFTKCQQKFSDKWQKTEAKAGPGVCPSEGDESSMDARITLDAAEIATLLAGGGTSCFAGHCDWRVPNARELQRIVDYEVFSPAVDPAFHQSATCTGCTDVTLSTCSCTASSFYWASTTRQASAFNAWGVVFSNGDVSLGCELRDDARWGALLLV